MNTQLDPQKLLERGRQLLAQRNIREAESIARTLDRQYPNNPHILVFVAEITAALGDFQRVEQILAYVVKAAPGELSYFLMYSGALASNGKQQQALDNLEQALLIHPDDAEALQAVGAHFSKLGEQQRALFVFEKALRLKPDSAQLNQNIAACQRFLGNLKEAEAYAERAVQLDPSVPDTIFLRSDVRKVSADNNHIENIRQLISEKKVSGNILNQCYFALAKEYEDIGAYEESFAALQQGCAGRRKTFQYQVEAEVKRIEDIIRYYDRDFFTKNITGYQGDKTAIFILGMPRTGSTLVEQFLAGHSQVTAIGERAEFSRLLSRQTQTILQRNKLGVADMVSASRDMDFQKLGQDYLHVTSQHTQDKSYFIDKLPLNFLNVGLILTALPDAKIIHVHRHPMDTCYAVYKMLFDRAYPFSYDLDELSQYFVAYTKLMKHWKTIFGERLCDISYEDVVADKEASIRRLVDYVGLPWEESCLNNQNSTVSSTTASAAQARKPVYSSSIGMWKNYEQQLAGVRQHLEQQGIEI